MPPSFSNMMTLTLVPAWALSCTNLLPPNQIQTDGVCGFSGCAAVDEEAWGASCRLGLYDTCVLCEPWACNVMPRGPGTMLPSVWTPFPVIQDVARVDPLFQKEHSDGTRRRSPCDTHYATMSRREIDGDISLCPNVLAR